MSLNKALKRSGRRWWTFRSWQWKWI